MNVQVLVNHQISPAIVDLIAAAKDHVDIISPYIQLWGHLEQVIKQARKRGVEIRLFARSDQREKLQAVLEGLAAMGVKVHLVELLHAKLYLSEDTAILSSMNLYDFSSKNSEEIAVMSRDAEFVAELHEYRRQLAEDKSQNITRSLVGMKVAKKIGGALKSAAVGVVEIAASVLPEEAGYCIRCKAEIDYNPDKPLCAKCYASWKKYGDEKYQEKYCHDCGVASKTSVAKPVCYKCYKAANGQRK